MFRVRGSGGQVLINGRERTKEGMQAFLRMSCYIQQDSSLRASLTVQEAMMVAAELKLGTTATRKEKQFQVIPPHRYKNIKKSWVGTGSTSTSSYNSSPAQ